MRVQFRQCVDYLFIVFLIVLLAVELHGVHAARTNKRRSRKTSKKSSKRVTITAGNSVDHARPGERTGESRVPPKKAKEKPPIFIKSRPTQRQPPNIIMIIADDLGYNDVGYHGVYGKSLIRTPYIDKLAYGGVRLENYYVQPVCTPTRSQLMTGRYQIHTGMQHINLFPGRPCCLPLDETTLAQELRRLGYSTHAVGKWHLGYAWRDCLPTRRGFDSFFGNVMGSGDHYSHNKSASFDKVTVSGKALYFNERIHWKHEGQYSTILYTNRARQIMRRQPRHKPLFLYLSYEAVHTPLSVPEKYTAVYKHEIHHSKRRRYAGLVGILDEAVNNITEALKYNGLWDNSVLIFTTDNGGRTKPKSAGNNWPLRGGKSTLWEGGIRAVGFVNSPLLPQKIRGTVNKQLIHVSDWFPTIVKGIAGGKLQTSKPLDGVNQWKTISKGTPTTRKEILHNIDPLFTAAHWTKDYERRYGKLDTLPFNATMLSSIRVGDWKLMTGLPAEDFWEPPRESGLPSEYNDVRLSVPLRLYNIRRDPNERQDLAPYYRNTVYRLLKRLQYYQNTAVRPLNMGVKDWRASPAHNGGAWRPWMD